MAYERLKAAYLKKSRTEQNLKLEALASISHFSVSYLSELERYKKTMKDKEWQTLFQWLNKPLPSDILIQKKLNFFQQVFLEIYFNETQKLDSSILQLQKEQQEDKDSIYFLHSALIQFIYAVSQSDLVKAKSLQTLLNEWIDYLDEHQRYCFMTYSATYAILAENSNQAINLLKPLNDTHLVIPYLTTMKNYYLANAYFAINDPLNAYYYLTLAKESSIKENNIFRYFSCLLLEANLYSEQALFSQAESIYYQILEGCKNSGNLTLLSSCTLNLSYCLIKQKKFQEALNLMNQKPEIDKIPQAIFNRTYCLYHINSNQCLSYVTSQLPLKQCPFLDRYLHLFVELIQDDSQRSIEKHIQGLLSNYANQLDNNAKVVLYQLLLEYYQRKQDVRKQLLTMEALLALK